MNFKKLLAMTAIAGTAMGGTGLAVAATVNVDATANFLAALALTKNNDMDFATVEVTGAPAGGDTASLGTDGTITYAGNFAGAGTGTAGEVQITAGSDTNTVDVSCDTTATLSDGAGSTIDAVSAEIVQEGSTGAFGTGTACAGTGTPSISFALDIGGGTADQVFLGAQLDGSTAASFTNASHSSASAGGTPIGVEVVYQ